MRGIKQSEQVTRITFESNGRIVTEDVQRLTRSIEPSGLRTWLTVSGTRVKDIDVLCYS